MTQSLDVIIIGAGPAGLAAGIYTGRSRLRTIILEKGIAGGQILMSDFIENYPGFPEGIAPFELMESFRRQTERFGAEIVSSEVLEIKQGGDGWLVRTRKQEYVARSIIIATGSAYRRLGIPGEAELTGHGVSFCATCDGAFFRDRVVAVVGGGSWALTEALFLTKFARIVKLIHRRDQFRAEKILQERVLENPRIEVVWDSVIEEIRGKGKLESLRLRNRRNQTQSELNVEGLFVSIGMDPLSEFVRGLVELNEWNQIKVGKAMETSRRGIFAAGDVTDACPQQVATAVGSGVSAAIAVDEYLQRLRPLGIPAHKAPAD